MSERRISLLPGRVEPAAGPPSASRYTFGTFSIDLRTRRLPRGAEVVPLPAVPLTRWPT